MSAINHIAFYAVDQLHRLDALDIERLDWRKLVNLDYPDFEMQPRAARNIFGCGFAVAELWRHIQIHHTALAYQRQRLLPTLDDLSLAKPDVDVARFVGRAEDGAVVEPTAVGEPHAAAGGRMLVIAGFGNQVFEPRISCDEIRLRFGRHRRKAE